MNHRSMGITLHLIRLGRPLVVDLQPSDAVQTSLSFQDGGLRAQLRLDHRKDHE